MNAKKLAIGLLLSTLSLQSMAQSRWNKPVTAVVPAPEVKTDPIKDQVELTRSNIQNMLDAMRNLTFSSENYEHEDYKVILEKFNKRLEKALVNFNKQAESIIVKPIGLYLESYYNVKNNPSYSEAERTALLNDIVSRIKSFCKEREGEYLSMIEELVNVIVGMDVQLLIIENPDRRSSYDYITFRNSFTSYEYNYTFKDKYNIQLTNLIRENACYSSSCKTLVNLLYMKYTSMIQNAVDKGFTFKFDNQEFNIEKTNSNYQVVSVAVNSLNAVNKLPFEISNKEYGIIQELIKEINVDEFDLTLCKENAKWRLEELMVNPQVTLGKDDFINSINIQIINESLNSEQKNTIENLKILIPETKLKIQSAKEAYNRCSRRELCPGGKERRLYSALKAYEQELETYEKNLQELPDKYKKLNMEQRKQCLRQ